MDKKNDSGLLCFACKHKFQDDDLEPCKSCRENGFKSYEENADAKE